MDYKQAWENAVHPKASWSELNANTDTEVSVWDEGDTRHISFQGSSRFFDDHNRIRIDWKQNLRHETID